MSSTPTLCMDSRQWGQRLAALAVAACDPEPGQEDDLLREGYALLAIAPGQHRRRFVRLPRRERFEALLAVGASECAALALMPDNAAYIVSRGSNGVHLASVMLDGDDEEVAAEAPNAGLALLAALAGALRHTAPLTGGKVEFDALELMAPPVGLLH